MATIKFDITDKVTPIYITEHAFTMENDVLVLQFEPFVGYPLVESPTPYDMTGKAITAAFQNGVESELLTVSNGIINLPIYSNYIAAGLYEFQLNVRYGDSSWLQTCYFKWNIDPSIITDTAPTGEEVDAITSLVLLVTNAVNSLAAVQAACEASELAAGNSADDSQLSAGAAASSLSQLQSLMGSSVATLTDGKLTASQIPTLTVTDTFTVSTVGGLTGLTAAETGDFGLIVVDNAVLDSYILSGTDPTNAAHWTKWGVGWVPESAHSDASDEAINADKIDGRHIWTGTQAEYDVLVLDPDTLYIVAG